MAIANSAALVRTDLDSGIQSRLEIDLHNSPTLGSFSPDRSLFVVPSWSGVIHVVNVNPLRRVTTVAGSLQGAFHSVAFTPDGRRLAAGSGGREAMAVWDVDSFERVLTLRVEGSLFRQAAFSRDGNVLGALAGIPPSTTLHLWRAPTWEEINAVEQRVEPPLATSPRISADALGSPRMNARRLPRAAAEAKVGSGLTIQID